MTILGSLSVRGLWDGRKLDKGLSKSRRNIKKMTTSLGGLKDRMGGVRASVTGVIGAIGVGGLAAMADELATSASETTRFANSLGLSQPILISYRKAADRLSISQDAVSDAMLELSRRSAEAATGTGSMFDAMQMLNIDVEKFNRLALDDKFSLIAKKLAVLNDTAKRNFLTDEIFGGASDQISGRVKDLDDLARGFDRVALATESNRLSAFAKDWKDITRQLGEAKRGLIIDASPVALEALQGAQVVLEALGVISGGKTAKEKAREAAGGSSGSIAGLIGRGRETAVEALGAVGSLAFADFGLAFDTARVGSQISRAERARQAQFRQPQIQSRPVQLVPANL